MKAVKAPVKPKHPLRALIGRIGIFARVSDVLYTLGFGLLAYHTGHWYWWLGAAFCAVTAVTAPAERVMNKIVSKLNVPARGR